MAFECRIEADSLSPDGHRITTMILTYPRIIHCELLTHRALSRNSASSRAIPVAKMIAAVEADPFIPEVWGRNQKGMQAGEPLDPVSSHSCLSSWKLSLRHAILNAQAMAEMGAHKQWANRLLEPFAWITVVVTATDWANFFALRCHPDAQPEIGRIATMMRDAMAANVPEPLQVGEWHLPFVPCDEWHGIRTDKLKLISAGRSARVSYLGHDGTRDPAADIALAKRLIADRHFSPFEHVATPMPGRHGNLTGWRSMRLDIPGHVVEESR